MAKLVAQNHPALHHIAEEVPVEEIASKKIQKVIADMKAVLNDCPRGVAIAAPQIGVPLRIFVVHDTTADKKNEEQRIPDLVAINPQLIKRSKKTAEMEEGCLSIPNQYGKTIRSTNITLRAFDEHGAEYTRGAGGLLAHIFQHETDHLDGILYVDHAHETWETDDLYEKIEK
ncbi:MAG: peptide deformylase [Candidatus Paceibacterota bacterium]